MKTTNIKKESNWNILSQSFLLSLLSLFILASCDTRTEDPSPPESVPEARDSRQGEVEARQELSEREELEQQYDDFREEADERLSRYEDQVEQMQDEIPQENEGAQQQVDVLDQELDELRREIDDYRVTTQEGWETFRTDFNRRMRDVEQSVTNVDDIDHDRMTIPQDDPNGADMQAPQDDPNGADIQGQ